MHNHSDAEIKTCRVCQQNIKETREHGEELDKSGVWHPMPKDFIKKGGAFDIYTKNEN